MEKKDYVEENWGYDPVLNVIGLRFLKEDPRKMTPKILLERDGLKCYSCYQPIKNEKCVNLQCVIYKNGGDLEGKRLREFNEAVDRYFHGRKEKCPSCNALLYTKGDHEIERIVNNFSISFTPSERIPDGLFICPNCGAKFDKSFFVSQNKIAELEDLVENLTKELTALKEGKGK